MELMVDLQRADRADELRDGRKRHGGSVCRLEINARQVVRPDLKLRRGLKDYLIVVHRRVNGGNLAHTERIIQFLANLIDGDAVDRRLLAIDLNRDLRIPNVK